MTHDEQTDLSIVINANYEHALTRQFIDRLIGNLIEDFLSMKITYEIESDSKTIHVTVLCDDENDRKTTFHIIAFVIKMFNDGMLQMSVMK